MGNPCCALDDHFKGNRLRAAFGALNGGDQSVDRIDIFSTSDLGDHDLVKSIASLFHDVHNVFVPIGGVEPVDAHTDMLCAPVDRIDRLDHIGPRRVFVRWGNRVFKIEVYNISSTGRHLGKKFGVGPWSKQLTPVRPLGSLRLNAKTHDKRAFQVRKLRFGLAVGY